MALVLGILASMFLVAICGVHTASIPPDSPALDTALDSTLDSILDDTLESMTTDNIRQSVLEGVKQLLESQLATLSKKGTKSKTKKTNRKEINEDSSKTEDEQNSSFIKVLTDDSIQDPGDEELRDAVDELLKEQDTKKSYTQNKSKRKESKHQYSKNRDDQNNLRESEEYKDQYAKQEEIKDAKEIELNDIQNENKVYHINRSTQNQRNLQKSSNKYRSTYGRKGKHSFVKNNNQENELGSKLKLEVPSYSSEESRLDDVNGNKNLKYKKHRLNAPLKSGKLNHKNHVHIKNNDANLTTSKSNTDIETNAATNSNVDETEISITKLKQNDDDQEKKPRKEENSIVEKSNNAKAQATILDEIKNDTTKLDKKDESHTTKKTIVGADSGNHSNDKTDKEDKILNKTDTTQIENDATPIKETIKNETAGKINTEAMENDFKGVISMSKDTDGSEDKAIKCSERNKLENLLRGLIESKDMKKSFSLALNFAS